MPFQVVYSVYQVVPKGLIYDFTAGDDVTSICSTQVTLQATIYGDPQGHRFLWEQLEGSDVTWETTQTELTVTISFSQFDDKKLRFWIDKGSKDERYDDVWVWGTPTEQFINSQGVTTQNNQNITMDGLCRRLPCSAVDAVTNIYSNPIYGYAECGSTNYVLRFRTPDCWVDRVLYYRIQEKQSDGSYNTVDTTPVNPNDLHYYTTPDVGKYYRITPVYQLNDINQQYDYMFASCDIYTASTNDGADAVETYVGEHGVITNRNISINNYNVRVRTKIERTPSEDYTVAGGVITSNNFAVSNYNVRVRTKIEQSESEDYTVAGGVTTVNNFTLTNYSVLARDGSQVGG